MSGTVMITTGGTGGHVFPGLAVAGKLIARDFRVFWLGTRGGMEAKLVPKHGVDFEGVSFAGLRGKGWKVALFGPLALARACGQSLRVIRRRSPDVVLGFGGFASFPGALMGVACGKPLVIHDANAVAGLANRVLAFGADRILVGFPNTMGGRHARKVEWVGNPLRDAIARVPPPEERFAGREGPIRLLVVGGSLGATVLNNRMPAALALLAPEARPIVVHQAGEKHIEALQAAYVRAGIAAECLPFIADMAERYAQADLVICRGGAITVTELAAVGIGAIIVPLPGAIADEQNANAEFLVAAGAAIRVRQQDLTAEGLAALLDAFRREQLLSMAAAARRLGRTDAADRVADACIALGGQAMKHKVRRIHFVGIGGAGMSGIAEVLATQGYQVSGSDLAPNAATRHLGALGIPIAIGHTAANVDTADAVVVSTAVASDNPEVATARAKGLPVVPRALMLADLMRLKQGIAVAGTHGKTTTTSLIASVLAEGGLDPTFVIGGRLLSADANARLGTGDYLVAEADESDASFLYLQPVLAVITNIDADHMETYGHDFAKLSRAFVEFAQRLPFYGTAVLCIDDANVRKIAPVIARALVTYGLAEDAQVRAVDVVNVGGRMRFTVRAKDAANLAVELNLAGEHNVQNALAAIAIGRLVGVADAAIVRALAEFHGVARRFQRYGDVEIGGGAFTLIDDYGHHPAEMAATIAAARQSFPGRRLLLAFQPHRYTRTRDLFEDFVRVLSTVDVLVLTDVYPAGETAALVAADGRALARAVRVAGKVEPVFVEEVTDVGPAIRAVARNGDVVVTMGAGSIGQVSAQMVAGERGVSERLPFAGLRGKLRYDEPLSRRTSWRCGGPADRFYVPADREDFAVFVRELPSEEPVTMLGLGSNLLVRDGGVRGTVIMMHSALAGLGMREGLIYAEAGVAAPKVARFAANHERAEAEFLAGIPGTVGGALAMNAGCYGGETWRYVARVEILTRRGDFEKRLPSDYVIGYRSVRRADTRAPESMYVAAWFAFPPGDGQRARERIKQLLQRRIATQPLELPNAGSVFRNPESDHAARLIESCGLKGFAIGGARVSEKHANFIVNPDGNATAADIESLIHHVREMVRAKTGIDLQPEVEIIGEARHSTSPAATTSTMRAADG